MASKKSKQILNIKLNIAAASVALIASVAGIVHMNKIREVKKYKKRHCVMKPKDRKVLRDKFGHQNVLAEMRLQDVQRYTNYLRMSPEMFDKLLNLVGPDITKSCMGPTMPINPSTKLALTLRYLASGDSQMSMAHSYVLARSTASNIINETTKAIWENLNKLVLPVPTTEKWIEICHGFKIRWDYPNVIGAIDGKHIRIEQPPDSGSDYRNYKGYFSTIFMAIVDYRYRFICIDIGAQGRQSDGGVFANSPMGRKFAANLMGVPEPTEISPYGEVLPYTLLGDEAFGLKTWLTTPYPGKSTGNMELEKLTFNYRQSRARRVVENTFGILVARWRILKTALEVELHNVDNIVKATVCLHNYCLIEQEDKLNHQYKYFMPQFVDHEVNGVMVRGQWRDEDCDLDPVRCSYDRNPVAIAKKNRDTMAEYFMTDGEVEWQSHVIV